MTFALTRRHAFGIAAAVAAVLGADGSVVWNGTVVSPAQAIIGRPATPMSYAGVARRTTARAVTATTVVVAPKCVQAVDAYGRVVTRCY